MLDAETHTTVHKKWYLFVSVLAAAKVSIRKRSFLARYTHHGGSPGRSERS